MFPILPITPPGGAGAATGWSHVGTETFAAHGTEVQWTGLGDADFYLVRATWFRGSNSGANFLTLTTNGQGWTQTGTVASNGGMPGSHWGFTGRVAHLTNVRTAEFKMLLCAKTGLYRWAYVWESMEQSEATFTYGQAWRNNWLCWTDTATEISDVTLTCDTVGNIRAGSVFSMWKLVAE